MDEQVVCFEKAILSGRLRRSKVFFDESLWFRILDNLRSIPRSEAESNYDFKQLVVYTLIRSAGLYLSYRRTARSQEERLPNRYSIGTGGHVTLADIPQPSSIDKHHK